VSKVSRVSRSFTIPPFASSSNVSSPCVCVCV
jgi:hypothetical protein